MLVKERNLLNVFTNDEAFNKLYSWRIQAKAARHWTPLEVAACAATFLVPENNMQVLDVGSGVGKFCLAAAHQKQNGFFYGVEQRIKLVEYANDCNDKLGLPNVFFIHGNFTQLDFRQFNAFYFFNSFYENLAGTDKIDYTIEHSQALYNYYNRYLYKQLEEKPKGTRVATYYSLETEMPPCYYVVKTEFNGLLKFWIKA